MLEAADAALTFIGDMSRDEFLADLRTIYAVRAAFITLGEASGGVPDSVRKAYPEIPWREIRHFRNFMIHVYEAVLPDRLWETAHRNLPSLREQLAGVLDGLLAGDRDSGE